jgi:hypothetical protein
MFGSTGFGVSCRQYPACLRGSAWFAFVRPALAGMFSASQHQQKRGGGHLTHMICMLSGGSTVRAGTACNSEVVMMAAVFRMLHYAYKPSTRRGWGKGRVQQQLMVSGWLAAVAAFCDAPQTQGGMFGSTGSGMSGGFAYCCHCFSTLEVICMLSGSLTVRVGALAGTACA